MAGGIHALGIPSAETICDEVNVFDVTFPVMFVIPAPVGADPYPPE